MLCASNAITRSELGRKAEAFVGNYLEQLGYEVLAYNFAIRGGEIDVIARRGITLAFIEVKFRQSDYFSLHTVITPSKQRKIYKTARYYIAKYGASWYESNYRFDVALVYWVNGAFDLEYLENAFVPHEGPSWS